MGEVGWGGAGQGETEQNRMELASKWQGSDRQGRRIWKGDGFDGKF